ncbi:MAG: hypothetical protein KAS70_08380 [Planctomycetes bacterium]|nr:hypothetical protein [Planctomycetota bacterium]
MPEFQKLFGLDKSEIKETVLLMPLLYKNTLTDFGIKDFSRGLVYSSGHSDTLTLIQVGICAPLLGDAVLYLKETACRNLILFGSCGIIDRNSGLDIGSLVSPKKCYAMESFSDLLTKNKQDWPVFYPAKDLSEKLLAAAPSDIKPVTTATVGSIKLEEDQPEIFQGKDIQVADMECSAFFSAARHIGRRAVALFYATDIVSEKPFYLKLSDRDRSNLLAAVDRASKIICRFVKKNSTS